MYPKDLITFCIPTFNRAKILDECLSDLIKKISIYGFYITISDNASTDNTYKVVEKYKKSYPNISYSRQNVNVGLDKNFEQVLKSSKSKYSWLLGDYARIVDSELNNVLQLLSDEIYDLLIVNSFGRVTNMPSREYKDINLLINDLGWHMTFMSSLVFNNRLIENADFQRYYNTSLIQHGIIFEYLSKNHNGICYWHDRNVIYGTNLTKSESWVSSSLEIFGKNWTTMVLSFPPVITLESKLKCIKDHGKYTGFFGIGHIARLKTNGWLNLSDCFKYHLYWKYISNMPWIILLIFSLIPDFLTKKNSLSYKIIKYLNSHF